ncbi:MAG: HEAT repeat domain-containing protein [Gammaproteobacteria bacterium]|nr:HEAT repeat domain-containing protein [Gammaproteobacteria bacterium]
MKSLAKLTILITALLLASNAAAQDNAAEELKMAAIEALISAPPERALPLVNKVLAGDHSADAKEKALFVLSQIDKPEAQATLMRFATEANGELQAEAIRMIGIGGNDTSLEGLREIYASGGSETREAVLEAYLIADDKQAIFDIAVTAEGDDFEEAVDMLGAMGAREELRELSSRVGASEELIDAYAISGDLDALKNIAQDSSKPELQAEAIEAMGIVGGDDVGTTLVQIYKDAQSERIREAALDGMLISGHDTGVIELYRASDSPAEKKELLEYLVMMGSDEVWQLVDAALDGGL